MKFGQIIFSISISLLLFAAILVSENARFTFQSEINNPFAETQNVRSFEKNEKSTPIDILTPGGELFRFFPNSTADFTNEKRELINGEFFISSVFIKEKDLISAKKSFVSPFSPEKFKPSIAQLQVGAVYINMPIASVFVNRNKEKELIKIYAIDHSIEVFIGGATIPFVIPANMYITVKESLLQVRDNYGALSYTKLKKELGLNLSNFNLNKTGKPNSIKIQDKIILSLEEKDRIHELMKTYAQDVPRKWLWFESQNFLGDLSILLQKSQINFALGYPKEKTNLFKFKQKIKPFVLANIAHQNNDIDATNIHLLEFKDIINTKEWFEILLGNSFESDWNMFIQAHRSWLRNIFPDDTANTFVDFWNIDGDKNSFSYLLDKFSSTELLLQKRQYTEVLLNLEEIGQKITQVTIDQTDLGNVTNLRRVLFQLLKANEPFQKKSIFELYGFLIKEEVQLYKGEQKEEVQLENAVDILSFFENFMDQDSKSGITMSLVKFFGILDVGLIEKSRNTTIFTDDEKNLIKAIKSVGGGFLDKKTVDAIDENEKLAKALRLAYQKTMNKTDPIKPIKPIINLIDTDDKFLDLLETDLNLNINKINLISTENVFRFSDVFYKKLEVSGSYTIDENRFSYIKVDNDRESNLNKIKAKSFLIYVETNPTQNSKPNPNPTPTPTPIQNSMRALSEKANIQDFFKAVNISINIKDIEVLDFDYNKFKINNSVYNKNSRLTFIYYKHNDSLEKLIIKTGRTPIQLSKQIKRSDLISTIEKEIDLLSKKILAESY